jgi:hypothetical protein
MSAVTGTAVDILAGIGGLFLVWSVLVAWVWVLFLRLQRRERRARAAAALEVPAGETDHAPVYGQTCVANVLAAEQEGAMLP